MTAWQLRLCPQGVPTEDYDAEGPLPRLDESIIAPDGQRFYVTALDYDFEGGFDQPPHILVVARWKQDGVA
jgi:hypothetical protein